MLEHKQLLELCRVGGGATDAATYELLVMGAGFDSDVDRGLQEYASLDV